MRALIVSLIFCVCATACSRAPGLNVVPAAGQVQAMNSAATSGYKTLFAFNGADGSGPEAPLLDVKGQFYGTTIGGGDRSVVGGTIFVLSAAGKERALHSFGGPGDGAAPQSGLTALGGVLYATTPYGGKYQRGTVFSWSSAGGERVLHSFGKGSDGMNPIARLTALNGTLYGTTSAGGKYGGGTVFSVSPAGTERVIYSFSGTGGDGYEPRGGLTVVKGLLYGTTFFGPGNGTVFSMTTAGQEKIVHIFGNSSHYDGANPSADLIAVKNVLYGTTFSGGGPYQSEIMGTVFSVTLTGKERVLHSFGAPGDGSAPEGALLATNGVLYGTTNLGGANGNGTIFSITLSGNEKVLYSFGARPDGKNPNAGFIDVHGTLYGTATNGGPHPYGGTVYRILPSVKSRQGNVAANS
jgi:uncharacterized repeat protein (TIGR03803 family)